MRIPAGVITLLLLLHFSATTSFALGIEAAIGGWEQSPDGKVSYQSSFASESIDLASEANYQDESRVYGRVKIDLPVLPNFYFMATPMEFEGTGSKPIDFDFGGSPFDADVPFSSKTTINQYDLAIYYEVPLLETASLDTFNLEFGINVRRLEVDINIQQPASGYSEQVDETLYVPMVYLGFQFRPIDQLAFEAEARGIGYSGSSYYDLIGRVKYKFAGPAFLSAGYRYEAIEIDEKDIVADLEFSGPFAEVGFDL